jgi:hypothetical protein
MIELTVKKSMLKIAVSCAECASDLIARVCRRAQEEWIEIRPCETCIKSALTEETNDGISTTAAVPTLPLER